MNTNNLVKVITVLSVLVSLLLLFPVITNLTFLIRDRDLIINYKQYIKKYVHIDSLEFEDFDGNDAEWVYGYSKKLDNYKTQIIFNSIKDNSIAKDLEMKENGQVYKYIWYKKNIYKAYPANLKDANFPINKYLFNIFKLPFIWSISVLISFVMIKIANRRKMFVKRIAPTAQSH